MEVNFYHICEEIHQGNQVDSSWCPLPLISNTLLNNVELSLTCGHASWRLTEQQQVEHALC